MELVIFKLPVLNLKIANMILIDGGNCKENGGFDSCFTRSNYRVKLLEVLCFYWPTFKVSVLLKILRSEVPLKIVWELKS